MKLAGSLTRKSFADGRFFIAELTTAAKIQLPVKHGKMVTDYAKAIQFEGYNKRPIKSHAFFHSCCLHNNAPR